MAIYDPTMAIHFSPDPSGGPYAVTIPITLTVTTSEPGVIFISLYYWDNWWQNWHGYSTFPAGNTATMTVTDLSFTQITARATRYVGDTVFDGPFCTATYMAIENTVAILPEGQYAANTILCSLVPNEMGAAIYYTTDGSTPTLSSSLYVEPFPLAGNAVPHVGTTVKAFAVNQFGYSGPVASKLFTHKCAEPTHTPVGNDLPWPVTVTLNDVTQDAQLWTFTDDVWQQGSPDDWTLYTGPFTYPGVFLWSVATKPGYLNSEMHRMGYIPPEVPLRRRRVAVWQESAIIG
jgi:hypothetical protein